MFHFLCIIIITLLIVKLVSSVAEHFHRARVNASQVESEKQLIRQKVEKILEGAKQQGVAKELRRGAESSEPGASCKTMRR